MTVTGARTIPSLEDRTIAKVWTASTSASPR
jgi:hypothetical protein